MDTLLYVTHFLHTEAIIRCLTDIELPMWLQTRRDSGESQVLS